MVKRFIIVIGLALAGCTNEAPDCQCDAIYATGELDNLNYIGTYENTEIDCVSGLPDSNPTGNPDAFFVDCTR